MPLEEFDIQKYMSKNIEGLVKDIIKATLKNPKESLFMMKFAKASKKASKIRAKHDLEGNHIPPFLIASITSSCNLHCAGCYSRSNNETVDSAPVKQLTGDDWLKVFKEANELGINFILLAGGEPLLRFDVMKSAALVPDIMFPIFTNGTFMNDLYFGLFKKYRNLVPILSIEGNKETTDNRRGEGIYDKLIHNMEELKKNGLVFGASVTVTKENINEVTSEEFLNSLKDRGCKAVIFVEYVPTNGSTELAPDDNDREFLLNRLYELRSTKQDMVYIAFPGDEKNFGGCVAAGRGFFHINSHGGAEPCPFSPFSDINVKDNSLFEALKSPLFMAIRDGEILKEDHTGGCVLFEKRDRIEAIINQSI